mmetsp:Transcript_13654/g.43079  ORF Transcript_13654/g.43079 Transcript_13654/m.43079 type:complete len:611 (-) Transcript_13654:65-1897(-)
MEAFLDFCVGCVFFGIGIRFGLVPRSVYSNYIDLRAENSDNWDDANASLGEGPPAVRSVPAPGCLPTAIDLTYKVKTDDMTREDFHPIKHTPIGHFGSAMGLAGLAATWKVASQPYLRLGVDKVVWHILAIVAGVWFGLLALLYVARAALYPNKVRKEWMHPLHAPAFGVPPICLMLFAFLAAGESNGLSEFLFWAGASSGMALTVVMLGRWVSERKEDEHINAGWMIPPLSNFVAALVCPSVAGGKHAEACFFFYSIALLMWLALFAVTFRKAVVDSNAEDRARPLLFVWVAAPAVACSAYLAMESTARPGIYLTMDTPSKLLHFMSLVLFLALAWCFKTDFFARHKFDMSYWMFLFPIDALGISALQYHGATLTSEWSLAIAYLVMIAASSTAAVFTLHTATAIIRKQVFRPDVKWGPLSFMKMTHEAFRGATPALLATCENMSTGEGKEASVQAFAIKWRLFKMMHDEHSAHEDTVIFKLFNDLFPGVAARWNHDHEADHATLDQLSALVEAAASASGDRGGAVRELQRRVPEFVQHLEEHLRGEEDNLNPVGRKHVPLALMKVLVSRCWELTPAERWQELVPWVVSNLPNNVMRARFLKTWTWAMP